MKVISPLLPLLFLLNNGNAIGYMCRVGGKNGAKLMVLTEKQLLR
jgi:hypothetical protein